MRALVVCLCVGSVALPAAADEASDLVALLHSKPKNTSDSDWKEQRRAAARRLGDLGDKAAVPALIKVVQAEEFDIIGEYAIESLGKLGDARAVPALQQVASNTDRDRDQRRAARQALAKLGSSSSASAASSSPSSAPPGVSPPSAIPGGADVAALDNAGAPSNEAHEFPEGTLHVAERVQFAVGGASLSYDTIRDRPVFIADAVAAYSRQVYEQQFAYTFDGSFAIAAGIVDRDGSEGDSRALSGNLDLRSDVRYYIRSKPFYAAAIGAVGTSVTYAAVDRTGPDNDVREALPSADLSLGAGIGYGRIYNYSDVLRLRRIESVLRERRVLGRQLSQSVVQQVLAEWWNYRSEQGAHGRLVATFRVLKGAGVLLSEPDASTTYQVLQVLFDPALTNRMSGVDVQLGITETFSVRDDSLPVDDGRFENVLMRGAFGHQSEDGVHELVASGFARYALFTENMVEPAPWAVSASAAWRRYHYNGVYDPIGALEVGTRIAITGDGIDGQDTLGTRIAGQVAWLWSPNRASQFRLGSEVALQSGELFFGLSLDVTYGFLDASYFAGAAAASAVE